MVVRNAGEKRGVELEGFYKNKKEKVTTGMPS